MAKKKLKIKKIAKKRKTVRNTKRKEHLAKLKQKRLQKEQDKFDIEAAKIFGEKVGQEMKYVIFINEYLIDFNGTRAVIAAGYTKKKESAAVQAARMLKDVNVRKEIEERLNEKANNLKVDRERVIANILNQYNKADEREETLAALKAMELVGKHFNMWPTTLRNDPNNPVSTVQTIIYMPNNGRN